MQVENGKPRRPIQVGEAMSHVMRFARKGTVEHIPIEQCYGRHLGEPLVASHQVPPFNKSPYDGFAIRACDTSECTRVQPKRFEVIGTIGAGALFEETVQQYQAVRIMTGAAIPDGCDAVVMLERGRHYHEAGTDFVDFNYVVKTGENISFAGEDTEAGAVLVTEGEPINPGVTALLATFGYAQVPVSRKPTVGVLSTGSELLEIGEAMEPGKIRNSNAAMLQAQIQRAGGEVIYFGQCEDDLEASLSRVEAAFEQVDILLTTGGVSVGDFDYLPAIYEWMQANVLFNKIAMRPGSVTTAAEKDGRILFGLSGNPSACYIGFELYVYPLIRSFLRSDSPYRRQAHAFLGADFPKANPYDRFVRGALTIQEGVLIATPVGLDKSNVVTSLAGADCLIMLPHGTKGYERGAQVTVFLLEDEKGASRSGFEQTIAIH
ncbi:gephyrin-like molybdotransferase Glp [Aureibacillus halotolerans]